MKPVITFRCIPSENIDEHGALFVIGCNKLSNETMLFIMVIYKIYIFISG